MGLLDLFKKKEEEPKNNSVLLSMPMFNDEDSYDLNEIILDLREFWGLEVTEISGDNETATFNINGQLVAVAQMGAPIPAEEIEETASYTYLWNNVLEECSNHKTHALVSMLSGEMDNVERHIIFTQLNASILRTSNAIGIYQGMQTLLLPKALYIDFANLLFEDILPIQLWIYIGLVNEENSNSAYTYGLKEFGKTEIEIIESEMQRSDLYDFIIAIASYIIESDVTLNDGETIGFTADQKIQITESKAKFLDGNSLKLKA